MTKRRAGKMRSKNVPVPTEPVGAGPQPPTIEPAISDRTATDELRSAANASPVQPSRARPRGKQAGLIALGIGAWLLLTIGWAGLRYEVLRLPPFEDQAVGLWTEANFLAEHHFDYRRLRSVERHYMDHSDPSRPGTRSYLISALPSVVAVGMSYFGDVETHLLVEHLLQFAIASGVVLGLAIMVWRRCGPWVALCAALALATVPLFGVQAELLGMDIPLAAAVLATVGCMAGRRFGLAAIASCVAFLIKPTGILLTLANLSFVTLWWWSLPIADRARRRTLPNVWLANALALVGQMALFAWGNTRPQLPRESLVPWPELYQLPRAVLLFPDVAGFVAAAGVLGLIGLLRWQLDPKPQAELTAEDLTLRELLHELLAQHGMAVHATLTLGLVLISLAAWVALPRYLTCAVPLAILLLVWPVGSQPMGRWLMSAALAALALFNVANFDGRFFPDLAHWVGDDFSRNAFATPRSCVTQERSREYLQELHACRDLLQWLEQHAANRPIMLPHPYWYLATQPKLGYVRAPLDAIYASHVQPVLEGFERLSVERRTQGDHRAPLLVWTGLSRLTLPPAESPDAVRYQAPGPSPLSVLEVSSRWRSLSADEIEDWYFDATQADAWLAQRTLMRAPVLLERRQVQRALVELRRAITTTPHPPGRLQDALTGLFEQGMERLVAPQPAATGDVVQHRHPDLFAIDAELARAFDALLAPEDRWRTLAVGWPQATAQQAPQGNSVPTKGTRIEPADLSYRAGIAALESRRLPATRAVWSTALEAGLDPGRADAVRFVLARVELLCGDIPRAHTHWQQLAPEGQLSETAQAGVALADLQVGDLSSARKRLQKLSTSLHVGAEVHALRGILHVRAGEGEAAGNAFADALAADRDDPGIRTLFRGWCWRNAGTQVPSAQDEAHHLTAP